MANTRMYIRCNVCGACFALAKDCYEGFYCSKGEVSLEDSLNRFFDKHAYCNNKMVDDTFYDHDLFPMPKECLYYSGDYSLIFDY